ncbi:protein kinase [Sphaerotilus montanus]|uniref:Serine/threonine-protein kinase n=1 Tax=Sphaerotilus montanus TaxID=522889 RepID=A0A7Y9QVF5_9BURK|nr:serine/threonine-protein kinase [Sphaerotilus montanus]NYG32140.1 serine/threonine-protein kinase [Sphaerotilus montanus]NZD57614.1 protein kinase [Sphaerotilus montanus]
MTSPRPIFWKQDWAWAVLAIGVVSWLHASTDLARLPQQWLHDRAITSTTASVPASEVALVMIDEASQARHGRAPWPRDLHARLIDRLAQASVVVDTEPFIGHESERALAELQHLHATIAADPVLARYPELPAMLERSELNLDGDARLAASLERHQRTLLSLAALPESALSAAPLLSKGQPAGARTPAGAPLAAPWPLPRLRDAAAGVGHAEIQTDPDDVLRRHELQRQVGAWRVSSLAVLAAGMHRGLTPAQIDTALQSSPPRLGGRTLSVDAQGWLTPLWATGSAAQAGLLVVSAQDVLDNPATAARLQGRIVLISHDNTGMTARHVRLPDGRAIHPAEALARITSSLVNGRWVQQPGWTHWMPWLLLVAVAGCVVRVVPRATRGTALALSGVTAVVLLLVPHLLLGLARIWMPLTLPLAGLLAGWAGLRLHAHWQRLTPQHTAAPPALIEAPVADTIITTFDVMPLPVQASAPMQMPLPPAPAQPMARHEIEDDPDTELPADSGVETASMELTDYEKTRPIPRNPDEFADEASMRALEKTQPLSRDEVLASTALTAVEAPRELPRLGPYQLDRELGRGAMGRVYLAHDTDTGQEVAVKTLALAREFDGHALQEARQRFHREAEAASRLHHPDIVRVFSAGEAHGIAYIAMERLTGHDLTQHLRAGSLLPMATVVAIGTRIATALAHAHALGVIHRDIKPANVMIDLARGQVKVTDFGIARVSGASRTRTGLILGSPSYMSPEQIAGRQADGRSDLYSLGVLMFHMLTGELPLSGHTMTELMGAIANTPAPDVRSLRPSVPEALADVLGILLDKRAELRYPDGLELATDLHLISSMLQRSRSERHDFPVLGSVEEYAAGPFPHTAQMPVPKATASQSRR